VAVPSVEIIWSTPLAFEQDLDKGMTNTAASLQGSIAPISLFFLHFNHPSWVRLSAARKLPFLATVLFRKGRLPKKLARK
jgi:hypothetical protein